MSEITIRNVKLLETLNSFSDEFFSKEEYNHPPSQMYSSVRDMSMGEYYCDREYLEECLALPETVGVPVRHFAQPISRMVREHPNKEDWKGFMQKVKYDFAAEIGAHTSALLSYYPPGGFVGWHTNADATAYQVLFTWSTGNGYFRYYDKANDKIVTIQDVAGWQARHYYFGPENEPENHCWHSAYAGDNRITLAYKFPGHGKHDPRDQQARDLRDLLIEEIESVD
jgi:hypothetical protein|tara:strand:+ start:98 stop:775 length:678 start_codon:yes stop_codon:yes gene_type:complete